MYYKNYVSQVDEKDCGVACLAMILKNFGSNVSLAYLRDISKTDKEGTTALGLVKTAELMGMETKAIRADSSLFDKDDIPYPFIAHIITEEKYFHYVTVVRKRGNKLFVADPDPTEKIKKISIDTFMNFWTGIAIFVTLTIQYKPN